METIKTRIKKMKRYSKPFLVGVTIIAVAGIVIAACPDNWNTFFDFDSNSEGWIKGAVVEDVTGASGSLTCTGSSTSGNATASLSYASGFGNGAGSLKLDYTFYGCYENDGLKRFDKVTVQSQDFFNKGTHFPLKFGAGTDYWQNARTQTYYAQVWLPTNPPDIRAQLFIKTAPSSVTDVCSGSPSWSANFYGSAWTGYGVLVAGWNTISFTPGTTVPVAEDDRVIEVGVIIGHAGGGQTTGTVYIDNVSAGTVIPVELTSFNASDIGDAVELTWTTATETENLGFHVQRSMTKDGIYTQINKKMIPGAGNSEEAHTYSYIDRDVEIGNTYYYKLVDVDFNGNIEFHGPVSATVSSVPTEYTLEQNHPNPFNPETTIRFALKEAGDASLKIYNLQGQIVRTLESSHKEAGNYSVVWNGTDNEGRLVASGVYIYKLEANEFSDTKRMVFVK